jgi:hypothetical protein
MLLFLWDFFSHKLQHKKQLQNCLKDKVCFFCLFGWVGLVWFGLVWFRVICLFYLFISFFCSSCLFYFIVSCFIYLERKWELKYEETTGKKQVVKRTPPTSETRYVKPSEVAAQQKRNSVRTPTPGLLFIDLLYFVLLCYLFLFVLSFVSFISFFPFILAEEDYEDENPYQTIIRGKRKE